jgi:hypothetical protein
MITMKSLLALAVAVLGAALPVVAAAQAPTKGDLELQRKQKRSVVLPKQTPDEIRADADRAVSEYAAGSPPGNVVRETSPVRPSARPDLDYDVKGGIQSRQLNKTR